MFISMDWYSGPFFISSHTINKSNNSEYYSGGSEKWHENIIVVLKNEEGAKSYMTLNLVIMHVDGW